FYSGSVCYYISMDNFGDIELLILNYLQGTISDDERRHLKAWLDRSENNRLEFDRVRELWLAAHVNQGRFRFDSRLAFERFRDEIEHTPRRKMRIALSYPWAAAILLITFVGGAWLRQYAGPEAETSRSTAFQEITVPKGSRSSIILPDSTLVTINAGTTVRYGTDFGAASRDIYLDGEAYFVVKKSAIPFIVRSGTVQIKAVGTEFNVRGYSSENRIETTLVTGKVLVSDTSATSNISGEVTLLPNQKLIVAKEVPTPDVRKGGNISKNPKSSRESENLLRQVVKEEYVDPSPDVSWKDDEWVIYRESLEELSVKLERRYNVDIVFVDEHLKTLRYNGTLPDQSLEQVLKLMSIVSPIRYTVQGKTVVFSENRNFRKP